MRRPAIVLTALLALLAYPGSSPARSEDELFSQAVDALQRGAAAEAVDYLELLADRGFSHPDASFNRAAAYLRRAASPQRQSGDLGRAVAALEETLLLRHRDAEAREGIERIREEIARRRARTGGEPFVVRPSIGRAFVAMLPENVWALGAAVGSALLTLGLAARLWLQKAAARLGGSILASIATVVLLVFGLSAAAARSFRLEARPAVVVAEEARLLNAPGTTSAEPGASRAALPEGASVQVLKQKGRLAYVRWGTRDGWVARDQLRLLSRPGDL